ncbi:heterodisulfide reductase-related iron-sulfur binding cluster [Deinococcus radiophilus]|uniref:heterodisulfide reductase-related iron-sulfur binding cluster n=1 Tax=Deinococcus radiophilus TaxID=32062 RepID=UPI00361D399D
MQVCPVQDEQMLDIVDIRRNLVMVQGEFPPQLQTAFRGMERASNPWGISRDKRMEWAEGLRVPTTDENPEPDVLYWVGCAASYDPGAQKVARSFVQLLDKAGVNYAVLGKKEACTGDSARRAGNEFLYLQLAQENVETLNTVRPKLIVATCPHCMNMIGQEYKQIGGDYQVIHHTEYLQNLVDAGSLPMAQLGDSVTYHDPCYLGRHNGVYDAPRSLITRMAGQVLELERTREQSFCCGAGGAQFWKEEEDGTERVSDNRFKEIQARLDAAKEGKVLAVGCPFCKSMMQSTPAKAQAEDIVVKDVAELMLESVQRAQGEWVEPEVPVAPEGQAEAPNTHLPEAEGEVRNVLGEEEVTAVTTAEVENAQPEPMPAVQTPAAEPVKRQSWAPAPLLSKTTWFQRPMSDQPGRPLPLRRLRPAVTVRPGLRGRHRLLQPHTPAVMMCSPQAFALPGPLAQSQPSPLRRRSAPRLQHRPAVRPVQAGSPARLQRPVVRTMSLRLPVPRGRQVRLPNQRPAMMQQTHLQQLRVRLQNVPCGTLVLLQPLRQVKRRVLR